MAKPRKGGALVERRAPEDLLPVKHARYRGPQAQEGLRRAFDDTGNPAYAWEGVFYSTLPDAGTPPPPLPDWCVAYLRAVALRIFLLSKGIDFRDLGGVVEGEDGTRKEVPPKDADGPTAVRALGEALGFTTGNQNAFDRLHAEVGTVARLSIYEGFLASGMSAREAREALLKTSRTPEEPGEQPYLCDRRGNPIGYNDERSFKRWLSEAKKIRDRHRMIRGLGSPVPDRSE